MATYNELIEDKTRYPDDQKVTLVDGVEITLGDLRGQTMMRSRFTQGTQDLARQRDSFMSEKTAAELQINEAKEELARMLRESMQGNGSRGRTTAPDEDDVDEILRKDPTARRLDEKISRLEKIAAQADKRASEAEAKVQAAEERRVLERHQQALSYIKQHDPDVDEGELVRFAQSRGISRLDDAYRLHSEDRRVAKAVKDAEEKATKAAREQVMNEVKNPLLSPRKLHPQVQDDGPKTVDEAFSLAARDPEIAAIARGEA